MELFSLLESLVVCIIFTVTPRAPYSTVILRVYVYLSGLLKAFFLMTEIAERTDFG